MQTSKLDFKRKVKWTSSH